MAALTANDSYSTLIIQLRDTNLETTEKQKMVE